MLNPTLTPSNDLLTHLEKEEQKIIKQINNNGYRTPYEPEADGSLPDDYSYMVGKKGRYRRFIIGFDYVQYHQLRHGKKQVRHLIVDDGYVDNVLHSKVVMGGGLRHPTIVTLTEIPNQFEIGAGHHRAKHENNFSTKVGAKVPIIKVSRIYDMETGKIAESSLEDLRSRVRTNKGPAQLQVTLKGGVKIIAEAFDTDSTFDGKNPSGVLPPRRKKENDLECGFDWDDLIEDIFEDSGNFTDKSTRTKLYNMYKKSGSASKIVDMGSEKEKNDFLTRQSYSLGLNGKGKRKSSHMHYDENKNCIVLLTDNNGRDFEKKIASIMEKSINNESYRNVLVNNGIRYIDIMAYLYNSGLTKADVDTAYSNLKHTVEKWANVIDTHPLCPLKVRNYVTAKMLVDNNEDADRNYSI
jgi:hypothetical protein